ncbi:MAG TPA: serine hydrolase [Flavobacteriales bacterium]|nr:serine hydrolase [Flavobacteriales bacterium]
MRYLFFLLLTVALYSCSDNGSASKAGETTIEAPDILIGNKALLIDQHLRKLEKENNFSGGLFISHNDSLIFCKGYGMANREAKISFSPATLCCIGSITKNFTAAGILALYRDGKLKLDNTLSDYFKNVPADKKNITIHQLLTHSAGFHEFLEKDKGDFEELPDQLFLKRAWSEPLAFKPGTKAVYTNVGMSIAALIIEKASGKEYELFLKETFFDALQIKTGYYALAYDSTKIAVGYQGKTRWGTLQQRYKTVGGGPYWNLKGNGGLYASLTDMYIWSKQSSAILPDSLMQLMFTPYIEEDGTGGLFSFGYGCSVTKSKRGTKMVDNGGSNGIYHARLIRFPEEGLVFYMVTNNNACNTNTVLPQVTQLYFEGHISQNAAANLNSFESKGAEFIYKTILERGPDYFTKNIVTDLRANNFAATDDMLFLEAGQRLIKEQKLDEALALYTLYTKKFPGIIIAWNDLGEVYLMKGNKAEAKKCFEKALELKPDNERAKRMLKEL